MSLSFRPLKGSFGAEVIGVDPTLQVDEPTFLAIEDAWYRHSILLFRHLEMTPSQHIGFTRRLGPLHIMQPLKYNLQDHPEVFVVSNAEENGRQLGMRRVGLGFHTDGEDKAVPNAGSFLYAREVPSEGGDTMWADLYAAWYKLPGALKHQVLGRRARFSRIELHHVHYPGEPPLSEEQKRARPDVWHPIARRHPRTGRTALYIGRWAVDIEGMPKDEGMALIQRLQEHSRSPEFIYRHRWQVGDAMLWDNRCTLHSATEFDETRHVRTMLRTTLEGETPLLAESA